MKFALWQLGASTAQPEPVSTAGRFIWIYISADTLWVSAEEGSASSASLANCTACPQAMFSDNPKVLPAECKILLFLIFPINLPTSKGGLFQHELGK